MLGDHIRDKDYVVVANDTEPGSDEIVVVVVNGQATLKRIRTEGDQKSLESSNPDKETYPSIPVSLFHPGYAV
jgi:SOS-response transcriptional repressor LexA